MQTRKAIRYSWIAFVYVLLYSLSIPWYLPKGQIPRIWFGLPHWVVISLSALVAVAIFTVFVIRHYWDEIESDDQGSEI